MFGSPKSIARTSWVYMLFFVSLIVVVPSAYAETVKTVLPPASVVKGWKLFNGIRVYNRSNIYNLIDGEADAVLSYDFVSCAHAEYGPAKASRPVITMDVYDMTDPLNAYGMFGSDRMSGPPVKIGAEGVRIGQTGLNFWKGKYVVRGTIVAMGSVSPQNKAELFKLVRAAAARIYGSSEIPPLIHALPPGYRARSQQYVRANVAGHSFLKNAVTAMYPSLGFGATLFICQTPSPVSAKKLLDVYKKDEKSGSGMAPLKGVGQGGFHVVDTFQQNVVVAIKGKYLVGVIRAKSAEPAIHLVKVALDRLR